ATLLGTDFNANCMSPKVFDELVWLIENDPIFHNNSNVPQLPVPIQLTIFLVHIGHYGNGSSPKDIAQFAGVSIGTVENATNRCLIAFLHMHDDVIMYPIEEQKEAAKQFIKEATCPEW